MKCYFLLVLCNGYDSNSYALQQCKPINTRTDKQTATVSHTFFDEGLCGCD